MADGTANPTARSMARYALGLVLKKTDPERALALFDEAAELAASVHNFWWEGIALMEAAATRAVHGDPGGGGPGASSTSSTTGTGSAIGPSSGSTCATSSACSCGSAPTRRPWTCTTACSRRASRRRSTMGRARPRRGRVQRSAASKPWIWPG